MDRQKTIRTGITAIVFVVFLTSPVLAHRKYRVTTQGPTRWGLQRHTHTPSESAESAATTQSKTKGFDLLGGAAGIVTGTFKILGNAVDAVFGGKAEPVSQTQKIGSRKDSSQRRNYSFTRKHKHPSSMPR